MPTASPNTSLSELIRSAEVAPAIFNPSQLWWGLQAAAVRKFKRSGRGTAMRNYQLTRDEAQHLANLTDAEVSLALERAIMHISALETSIFTLVQVQVINGALLTRNRWLQYTVKVTVEPRR